MKRYFVKGDRTICLSMLSNATSRSSKTECVISWSPVTNVRNTRLVFGFEEVWCR